jgi:undecaprenyl diphosphate synthase
MHHVPVRRASPVEASPSSLAHLLVVGGTTDEWAAFDDAAWQHRVELLAALAHAAGAPWVTIRPIGGTLDGDPKLLVHHHDEVTVIVDTDPDPRARFTRALERLVADGVRSTDVSEAVLAEVLLAPADCEPDLAVILGPADRLPTTVTWELAYAELVFLPVHWTELAVEHLATAIDEFRHRERRFGGLDR